jgi:hypothetical protein
VLAKTEIEKLEEEVRQLESVKRIRELQQKKSLKNGLLKETNGGQKHPPPQIDIKPPPKQDVVLNSL